MMRNPALVYRQFSVQGATPLGLVVMLYDGAITYMQRARAAMEAGDVQRKCDELKCALAIFAQLEGSLNFEQRGEVARTLKALYVHARTQTLKANLENSAGMLQALIEEFRTVRDAWQEGERRLAMPSADALSQAAAPPAQCPGLSAPDSSPAAPGKRPPARSRLMTEDWSDAGTTRLSVFD